MRVALAAMLLVACGRDAARNPPDSPVAAAVPVAAVASNGTCPATGKWAACQVVVRLDQAGLAPRLDSAVVDEPPLAPRGTLVHLGPSDLEIYIYIDVASRERDQAKLDKTRYIAFDAPLTLKREATLIHSRICSPFYTARTNTSVSACPMRSPLARHNRSPNHNPNLANRDSVCIQVGSRDRRGVRAGIVSPRW